MNNDILLKLRNQKKEYFKETQTLELWFFYLSVALLPFLYVLEWWMIVKIGLNASGERSFGISFLFFIPRVLFVGVIMRLLTISYIGTFTGNTNEKQQHNRLFIFISFLLTIFQIPILKGMVFEPLFFNPNPFSLLKYHLFLLLFVHLYSLTIILTSKDNIIKKAGTILILVSFFLFFLITECSSNSMEIINTLGFFNFTWIRYMFGN